MASSLSLKTHTRFSDDDEPLTSLLAARPMQWADTARVSAQATASSRRSHSNRQPSLAHSTGPVPPSLGSLAIYPYLPTHVASIVSQYGDASFTVLSTSQSRLAALAVDPGCDRLIVGRCAAPCSGNRAAATHPKGSSVSVGSSHRPPSCHQ